MKLDEDYEPTTQEDIDYYNQDDIRKSNEIDEDIRKRYFDQIISFRDELELLIDKAYHGDNSIFNNYIKISVMDLQCEIVLDTYSAMSLLELLNNALFIQQQS